MEFKRPKQPRALVFVCAAALLTAGTAAETDPESPPPPLVAWESGRLVVLDDTVLPAVYVIAGLITQQRFGEALARIEGMSRPDVAPLQVELALAIAGHPSFPTPEAVLEATAERLDKALTEAPADPHLLLLHHQLETYRMAADLKPSGLGRIRCARNCARRGQVEAAVEELTPLSHDARQAVLERWALCASVEGHDEFEPLHSVLSRTLRDALRAHPKDPTLQRLSGVLARCEKHPWASIAVRPGSPLYPQWRMQCMRALHWSMPYAGVYRPHARQALGEALTELKRLFPENDVVRSYAGEKVPWGSQLGLSPPPSGAPGWAVAMRELRARVDYITDWWFLHRQKPDGAFSDDWGRDCRILPAWLVSAICCGNPQVETGAARLLDGAWSALADEGSGGPHTERRGWLARIQLENAVMPLLFYGDPLYLEPLLPHAHMIRDDYTAVNEQGHRHFKHLPPGLIAQPRGDAVPEGMDFLIAGQAMRPAATLAWYSNLPDSVSFLHDWTLAWSEDAARLGVDKPGGILPACVRFSDDNVDGVDGRWWDPGQGASFEWDATRQMHVFGKSLVAWTLTGNTRLLDGIRGELDLVRRYLGAGEASESDHRRGPGSAYWAARQVANSGAAILGPYRAATGDRQYDCLDWTLLPSYTRFLISGDPHDVTASLSADLAALRADLPLLTAEAPAPDRVALAANSLLGPLTGSPALLTDPPSWAVTWRDAGEGFTALVRDCHSRGLTAWVYSFADNEIHPCARFWRLEPGVYHLRLGPDRNADGVMDASPSESVSFRVVQRTDGARFALPPGGLHLLEVVMDAPDAKGGELARSQGPVLQPDVAIMPRDIVLGDTPRVGAPCRANVILHNIGAADADDVTLDVTVFPPDSEGPGLTVGKVRYGTLPHPGDLSPKRGLASFEWRPDAPGRYRIRVAATCSNPQGEIWSGNNQCELEVSVAE
jgi:hypothetical protein